MKDRHGPNNPNWKGGRSQTYVSNLYSVEGKLCERCGADEDIVRHHKDEDRANNDQSNIEILCRGCHSSHHHKGKSKNWTSEGLARLSAASSGNKYWVGKRHSDKSKLKMGRSQKKVASNRRRDALGRWA